MFKRSTQLLTRTLEALLVISLAVMAILVFGNVVLRYAFNSGLAVSEELSRLLFVWLIFLGAILASAQHAHIGFDSLAQKTKGRARKLLVLITGGLMLSAAVMFIVGGWKQTQINLGNSYPVLGISYAWLYGVAIVFGLGLFLTVSNNIWTALRRPPDTPQPPLTQDLGNRINEKIPTVSTGQHTEQRP